MKTKTISRLLQAGATIGVFPALLAMALVKLCTLRGPVITTDSVYYLQSAENLLAGNGLTMTSNAGISVPLAHWAPGYPFLLAAISRFSGMTPLQATAWVGMACAALTVILMGRWLRQDGVSGRCLAIALMALAIQPDLMLLNTFCGSEPLYFPLLLATLLLLQTCQKEARWGPLLISALLAGLSILVRYAGLAIIPCGMLILFLSSRSSVGTLPRWSRILAWTGLALLPWIIWSAWLYSARHAVSRSLAWHPFGWLQFEQSLQTLFRWLFTPYVPWPIGLVMVLVLATISMVKGKPKLKAALLSLRPALTHPGLVFSVCSCMFLIVSISLYDFNTEMDFRILHPVFLAMFPLAVRNVIASFSTCAIRRWPGAFSIVMIGAVIGWGIQIVNMVPKLRRDGLYHTSRMLVESPLLKKACQIPADTPLYSNGPDLILFYCRRHVYGFPEHHDLSSLKLRPTYAQEWTDMVRRLRDEGAVLAYWHFMHDRWTVPTMPELLEKLPLEVVDEDELGLLYRWKTAHP